MEYPLAQPQSLRYLAPVPYITPATPEEGHLEAVVRCIADCLQEEGWLDLDKLWPTAQTLCSTKRHITYLFRDIFQRVFCSYAQAVHRYHMGALVGGSLAPTRSRRRRTKPLSVLWRCRVDRSTGRRSRRCCPTVPL